MGQPRKLLFLPQNMRAAFFLGLLAEIKKTKGWQISVVCTEDSRRNYRDLVTSEKNLHFISEFEHTEPWERDAAAVAEIDALIRACERESQRSSHRIILAGERDVGRAFGLGSYDYPGSGLASKAVRDNTYPEAVLRRMFRFARDVLAAERPDFLMSGYMSPPLQTAFYLVGRQLGVPFVANRLSKVCSGMAYWSDDASMGNVGARVLFETKRAGHRAISDGARQQIGEFRARPTTVAYIRKNWQNSEAMTWVRQHRAFLGSAKAWVAYVVRGGRGRAKPKPVPSLMAAYYQQLWRRSRQQALYRRLDEAQLQSQRYVYFPLHKEPELAINYMAPFWHSQLNSIQYLSANLPFGCRLLVRDHRLNVGRRPTRWLRNATALPGVTLIDPLDGQFKYLRNAAVVVTDNGSSGWEGLLLGRPVITLASTFYDGPDLAHRLTDTTSLDRMLIALTDAPPPPPADGEDRLGWLIDAERETSHMVDPADYRRSLELLDGILPAARTSVGAHGVAAQ